MAEGCDKGIALYILAKSGIMKKYYVRKSDLVFETRLKFSLKHI